MNKQIAVKTREKWVDDIKVIACILVVLGHFFQSMTKASIMPENDLYKWFNTTPDFLDVLEEGFKEFFEKEVPDNPQKAEYLIPIFIGELLEQGKMSVKVLKTNDTWYGMTYHEDVAAVKSSFKEMLENGVYKADLFSDL